MEPYWIDDAGHYTIPDFIQYCNRILTFILSEVKISVKPKDDQENIEISEKQIELDESDL